MSSVYANIQVNVNTASAVNNLKLLQKQAALLSKSINSTNAAEAAHAASLLQQNAVGTGAFTAKMVPATTAVQSFNDHLLKNKFSLGDYARYSAAATRETGLFNKALKSSGTLLGQRSMIDAVAAQRVKALATQYVQLGASVTGANQVMALTPAILNKNTAASQMALEKQRLMNMLIADGSTKMLNWGKNMQWAGRQLMVGFTLPLTLFAGIAISVFNDMEKQALEFKKVYGDLFTTEPEMQKNLEAVKKLGLEFTKYGIAVKDTMKMATTAAASGQKNEDLIAATTEATRLQVLGQMEAQDAMATTISLQTAFKMSNTELTESINFLNAVENQTVLTLQDVTEAIPRVATVINSFGGGVQELSVLLVGMKEGGVSAAEGANALKNSLARLITPTAAARKMTAAFGIDLEGIVKNNRGELIPMLTELAEKLDGLGGTQRQEVLSTLFGKYQYARIGVMLQSLTDKSSQASTAMKLVNESTKDLAQTAERELGRVEESTSSKSKAVMEKLKAGLIPIGEEFLKAAMPILEFIGKIIEKFNSFGDTVKQTIVTITTIVGIIAPTFLMMLGLFGNLIAQGIKTIQLFRRVAGTIAGNGAAWQRLTLEELEAQTMSSALNKQTVNTTGALMSQVGAINLLNNQLKIYIQSLMQATIASSALAGKGAPAMLGRVAKVKPPSNMLNDGGKVFDSSKSTYVPGTGNKDTVPAVLTPGEFVINKKATKENISILQAINNGEAIERNKGGMIPGMQYFARAGRVRKPKIPKSISPDSTAIRRGQPDGRGLPNDVDDFGGLNARMSFRRNLSTESSRLHSILQSVWSNRSRASDRTTLRPEGLLRPPRSQAPRISVQDDNSGLAGWVYSEKDAGRYPKQRWNNAIHINEPMIVRRKQGLEPDPSGSGKLDKVFPGDMLRNKLEMTGLLQHEMFHVSKQNFKYKSPKQQGREEAKAVVAQSIAEGRINTSYQRISRSLRSQEMVDPASASTISQGFGEAYLKHITKTQINRGRDIGNLRDFYQTTRRQRDLGIPTTPGSRTEILSRQAYGEVRRDAALSKIFDSFIPISSKSHPEVFKGLSMEAARLGIPPELFLREVRGSGVIETSALLMNARNLGPEVFNNVFQRLLNTKIKRKTKGLEEFFGGNLSRQADPLDGNVLSQLVNSSNPSFKAIRDNNFFNQQGFNTGNIVPGMGSKDIVPAMLTPGEFVINKAATQSNLGLLHQINNGSTPPELKGFNKGGPIPGVQYFGGGGQSSKGNLEFLHLFGHDMATKEQTERLKATSKNQLVSQSPNEQFRLYSNLGIIGPKDMQYGQKNATGEKMSKLFTPQLMDQTMKPFYKAFAEASGRSINSVMNDPAVRTSVTKFGERLGGALATHATTMTPAVMEKIVGNSIGGDPIVSKAVAHASQMTTLGYNRPSQMRMPDGRIIPVDRAGEHERAAVTKPQQREVFNQNQPFPAYTGWWSKKGGKFLNDGNVSGSAQPTGQAAAGPQQPQPKIKPAPLGKMPAPITVVPTTSRKDIAKQTRVTAEKNVMSRLNAESRALLPPVTTIGPITKSDAILRELQRREILKNLIAQRGSTRILQDIAEEQKKVGKQAMKLQRQKNKRDAKILAQTDAIGKNNAKLIAQQRDTLMSANPALTKQQATSQARRLVLPQPERAPTEPKPVQKQPTTLKQKARALARQQLFQENLPTRAKGEQRIARTRENFPAIQRAQPSRVGPILSATALPAAERQYSQMLAANMATILPRLEARAKLGLDGDQRAAKGQDVNRQLMKKLGLKDVSQLPKNERAAAKQANRAIIHANPEAYKAAQTAILAPSMGQKLQEARRAATGKVSGAFNKYNTGWQNRTSGPTFLRSGAVPVLDEQGKQVKGAGGKPMTQRAQSKMQKGAGKAAGGIGTVGMMASMMPMFMQDDKGKFMGMDPMAAMGGIMGISMLAQGIKAMIGSATAAISTIGMALGGLAVIAVAAGISLKMWRDSVNSSAKAAAELGANLGGAANAANKIGKVLGIDTPAQRQAKMQMGFIGEEQKLANDRFGQALSSDQGKAFVEELKKGTTTQRINKVQDYMSTAIATKQLTVEDAKLFTKTLATALGDPVMGTAVVRSISSAMASPNAMKNLADRRLSAVQGNAAITEVMKAPSLFAESTNDTGYQKSIATDVSSFAIGSAVQVIQDYANVIAMTREQYQQGLIDFEKYNNVIRESTAIQNKYSEILSKAVGGAVDVQGARMALDTQLVAGGMSQEQVGALTNATDIGVGRASVFDRVFTGRGFGTGAGNAGSALGTIFGSSLSSYQSDYVAREAQTQYKTTDSKLTDEQRQKLIDESLLAQEAAMKMFEGGLNENLKAAVLAGKMTADAAAALGTQLMNNSKGAGATQYQKMAEQGKGVLGLEQAGFIETTNAMGVAGLDKAGLQKYIDVGIDFSTNGGSLTELQTFMNSLPEGRRTVYVDIIEKTTYEGQTTIASGYTALSGAFGEENAAKITELKSSTAASKSTEGKPRKGGRRGSDLSQYTALNDARLSIKEKLGDETLAMNVIMAAEATQNGKPVDPVALAKTTMDLGSKMDFIQKTLPEDVLREIKLDTTSPKDIEHWNDVSKSFVDGWLTLNALNPNIKMSAVVEFLTVDEDGPIDEKTRAERVNSLNNAYSDLEKSKDVNIRKQAYITLGTAQIQDDDGNFITSKSMDETISSLVDKFGGGVYNLAPITLFQIVDQINDASALRAKADAIEASIKGNDPGGGAAMAVYTMRKTADAWENAAMASVGPELNNLKNNKSGGGGAKKETPVKDMNKGFLDQIKLYTNMDANLKKLNDARGKFAASLTKGKGIIQKLREAGISEGIISELASKGFDALKQGYNKFVTKGRANALGRNENELARIAAVGSATGSVDTAIKLAQNQTSGAKYLKRTRGKGKGIKGMVLNAEEMTQALNAPELADAFANVNTKEAQKQIQEYVNKVLKARPILEKAMREMADPRLNLLDDISKQEASINAEIALTTATLTQASDKKFASDYKMTKAQADLEIARNQQKIDSIQLEIDKKQESNDLDQHSIDLLEHSKKQYQDKIDLIQVSIDAYQKSIDAYQRENELRNQQANIINHSLDIMSQQEDQITDTYNKRVAALDEVAKINDYIINQQRSQLNLVQALSEGDVYAAAAAQQDMQVGNYEFAQDQMRTGLEVGRDNQIAGLTTETGLTRVQAEAELNRIKEMNYQNDLLVTGLQNEIYTKTQAMIPYKTQIESIDKNIAAYNETIWQRNNDIYNIEVGRIKPLEDANKELNRKLTVSSDQLAIDIASATMQYETQLDTLDLLAKNVELSLAQEAAASLVGKQWENILGLILEANRALADQKKLSTDKAARPAKNAEEAKANIDAAKAISDAANTKYKNTIDKINKMMVIATPAPAKVESTPAVTTPVVAAVPTVAQIAGAAGMMMATGGVVGAGGRDSVASMLTPGEFVMRKASVEKYGMPMLSKMNMGSFEMPRYNTQKMGTTTIKPTSNTANINAPVYNTYSINVPVTQPNASANDIANIVITKIKNVDNSSIRRINGY